MVQETWDPTEKAGPESSPTATYLGLEFDPDNKPAACRSDKSATGSYL
jgi:hypothetical protein